jgi:hypothetical protein
MRVIVGNGAAIRYPPKGAAIDDDPSMRQVISDFADNGLRVTTLASGRDIALRSVHPGDALLQRTVSPDEGMFEQCFQMQTSARSVPVRTQRP